LQQKKYNNIGAITLLTTLLDYNNSGDMSLFVSEQQIAKIEEKMQLHGFYDGADMSMMFNILRAREMIWGNFVDSYMRGKDPMAIDILFWNNDETRLPAKMASFYLRNCYLHNNFCQKNKIKIKDVYIDFSKINNDIFILATKDDHITPALGVFDNIKHLDNKKLDFVMSESGHVGGVVNPPWKNKYGYYYNKEQQHHEFSEWFANAKLKKESWWMLFEEWLAKRSGEKIKTTWHKKINLLAIDNAPGQYIYQK
jgi:polyhydroxyalkanoate synthase